MGAWHHRCWALTEMGEGVDWEAEIKLCDRYLGLDERNFHCWDYRRFVLRHLPSDNLDLAASELKFSTDKIHDNFSNYSAWHYRSKLLPVVHPSDSSPIGLDEGVRRDELDLVLNAAFTDPDDSSAWFYHKWLLASSNDKVHVQVIKRIPSDCIYIATSKEVELSNINCLEADLRLFSNSGNQFDKLWKSKTCPEGSLTIQIKDEVDGIVDSAVMASNLYVSQNLKSISSVKDEATKQILETEMSNCQELLELEPDSKWTLLTLALVAKSIDPVKHQKMILDIFKTLQTTDPKRRNYYADMRSEFTIRLSLMEMFSSGKELNLDLKDKELTTITHHKHLFNICDHVDTSGNPMLKC